MKVDQYAAYVKRVATDMQHHMFSLHTIQCTEIIFENIKKSYTIVLLFIVTEAQMSLLMETSDSPFSLHTNQHILHSARATYVNMSVLECSSRIALFSKQIFFQYSVTLILR